MHKYFMERNPCEQKKIATNDAQATKFTVDFAIHTIALSLYRMRGEKKYGKCERFVITK